MTAAGYSGTALARKLGIADGATLAVIGDPGHFFDIVAPLPPGVRIRTSARGKADVAVFFVRRRAELQRRIDVLGRLVFPAGSCWVCWPKQASGVATDVSEDVVRNVALPLGLVDNKVAAVDDTWSGLRLVWRQELR